MTKIETLSGVSRREFIGSTAAASGAFMIGFQVNAAAADGHDASDMMNAFLAIAPDNTITFYSPYIEMGQGTYTSLPQIIAEELDADVEQMVVEQAPTGPAYRLIGFGPQAQRFTGGSLSVRTGYMPLRQAGATARAMLMQAAADEWGVDIADVSTEPGYVIHGGNGERKSYGELAELASKLTPPEDVAMKPSSEFRLIGQSVKRTDMKSKTTGTAEFGMDVVVEGMVYAAVVQAPQYGAELAGYDRSAIESMPGFVDVVEIPIGTNSPTTMRGVAVVADSFWRAKKAADALPVEWKDGPNADFSSQGFYEEALTKVDNDGPSAENHGNAKAALAEAATTIESTYHAPYLAHATMEPMNTTAHVMDDKAILWCPNQGADFVAMTAAAITGLPFEAIDVRTPYLGGGFGRRVGLDYAAQAVTVSKAVGKPVKLVWTREEDMTHDFYRPLTVAKFRAGLDADGNPTALYATHVGDGPARSLFPAFIREDGLDTSVVEGAIEKPYAIENVRVDHVFQESPVWLGFWRSVGNSHNGFFYEAFIDEIADAAEEDPVAFRQKLLADAPRHKAVFDKAIEMSNYRPGVYEAEDGTKRAMGVAHVESFGSLVTEVVEVSIEFGEAVVHNVWCSVDCGFAINPDIVVAQMESGVAFGLSATLLEQIDVVNGEVQQQNFDTYELLPPSRMPNIEVEIVNSGEALGGIGEPGTPPVPAAVVNALAKLTGERYRTLPLSQFDLQEA